MYHGSLPLSSTKAVNILVKTTWDTPFPLVCILTVFCTGTLMAFNKYIGASIS